MLRNPIAFLRDLASRPKTDGQSWLRDLSTTISRSPRRLAANISALYKLDARLAEISNRIDRMNVDLRSTFFHNWASDKRVISPVYSGETVKIVALMRALVPFDVRDCSYIRVGRELDGGYVMVDDFSMVRTAVSCGIGTEASWDQDMAARGIIIHQFDHTIAAPPEMNERFRFHNLAIRACDAAGGITLKGISSALGEDAKGAILKLDIEGSEWDVLATVDPETLGQYAQIVVELHDMHYLPIFIDKATRAVENLTRDFFVTHVHVNNQEELYSVGGVVIPRVLEATLANRAYFRPAPLTRSFPTELDRRSDPRRSEIHLGKFAY